MKWLIGLFKRAHQHSWNTTHTNRYMNATRQECGCGLYRTMEWRPDYKSIDTDDMWDNLQWVHSDGQTSEYRSHDSC